MAAKGHQCPRRRIVTDGRGAPVQPVRSRPPAGQARRCPSCPAGGCYRPAMKAVSTRRCSRKARASARAWARWPPLSGFRATRRVPLAFPPSEGYRQGRVWSAGAATLSPAGAGPLQSFLGWPTTPYARAKPKNLSAYSPHRISAPQPPSGPLALAIRTATRRLISAFSGSRSAMIRAKVATRICGGRFGGSVK